MSHGRMGVLFFDKVTPSCQDICCWEIYVTSLKYPFIINVFILLKHNPATNQFLYKGIFSSCPFSGKNHLFFSGCMLTFLFVVAEPKPKKTSKTTTSHGGIPINQCSQQKSPVGSQVMVFSRASYCFKVAVDVVRKISKA